MSSNHGTKDADETKRAAVKGGKQPRTQDMGGALRSVYQQTVEERVPDEMMDLLGKLG